MSTLAVAESTKLEKTSVSMEGAEKLEEEEVAGFSSAGVEEDVVVVVDVVGSSTSHLM